VFLITPLLIYVSSAISKAQMVSRQNATAAEARAAAARAQVAAEMEALRKRADAEPTAFLWQLYGHEKNIALSTTQTPQMKLQHDRVIIDSMTDSRLQFHCLDDYGYLWLWTWTPQNGGYVITSEVPFVGATSYQFSITTRDKDRIVWKYWSTKRSNDWGYSMIMRPNIRALQERGWLLLVRDGKDINWKKGFYLDGTKNTLAEVSQNRIRLRWVSDSNKILDFRHRTVTFAWERSWSIGRYDYEWEKGKATESRENGELVVDRRESTFPNGPIYMSMNDSDGTHAYLLVRY
jgi:hypothetical protein